MHVNHVSIGSWIYRLEFSEERLYLNRRQVLSLCDHDRRCIVVAPGVSSEQLKRIVLEATSRIWDRQAAKGDPDDLTSTRSATSSDAA